MTPLSATVMWTSSSAMVQFNGTPGHDGTAMPGEQAIRLAQAAGRRVVVIGGGTGLSTLLLGLKEYTDNITAIVTVSDDGGGSGVLRREFGMLPPGDVRNCILALANTSDTMEKLLG